MRRRAVFFLSALALLWERLCNRFWAVATLIVTFAALALLGLPQALPPAAHIALIAFFATFAVALFFLTGTPFRFPRRDEVRHAVERDSDLAHRPLTTLADQPAAAAPEAQSLWQKHIARTAAALGPLKAHRPQPTVAQQDKHKLRYAALALLILGLAVARQDALPRLQAGVMPQLPVSRIAFDLWITPPEYTHEPALFLSSTHDTALAAPAGSTLHLRATHARFAPRLTVGDQSYTAQEAGAGSYVLDAPLGAGGAVTLTSLFSTLGQWNVAAQADTAPDVKLTAVETTPRAQIRLAYMANDDHGITRLAGIITPPAGSAGTAPLRFDIPATDTGGHVEDFSAHAWAGKAVTIAVEAEDGAGHVTTSAPLDVTLPVRSFTNQVAATLAEQRRLLLAKSPLKPIISTLAGIANRPPLYRYDRTSFLALDIAAHRLLNNPPEADIASTADILWNVAVRLDDGGTPAAQDAARANLQELSRLLNDPKASDAQLHDAFSAAQAALQKYLQAFAMNLRQQMQQGGKVVVLPPEIARRFARNIDINKMVRDMRSLGQDMSREDLQKLAARLNDTLAALAAGKMQPMPEKQALALEQLQRLDAVVRAEQDIYDRTGRADAKAARAMAKDQARLRQELKDISNKVASSLGKTPDSLAIADTSMQDAGTALGKGDAPAARIAAKAALDALQQGLDSAADQAAQGMPQAVFSYNVAPGGDGGAEDPLGRNLDDADTKLPDAARRQRVQEIIDELRRRSNDPGRSPVERDYIDRLLEKF